MKKLGYRSADHASGGMLSDAMGLGKSLSMISLIVSDGCRISATASMRQPTLIVVPLSLLSSWETEFDTHIEPRVLSYLRYYGSRRLESARLMSQRDVVITTYDTVALEWQKLDNGVTPLFSIDWHRVILDEGKPLV